MPDSVAGRHTIRTGAMQFRVLDGYIGPLKRVMGSTLADEFGYVWMGPGSKGVSASLQTEEGTL